MYLFGVPMTFVTAFLVSITIGLGIDYTIHISDRFAQVLEDDSHPATALYTTVQGTGGAHAGVPAGDEFVRNRDYRRTYEPKVSGITDLRIVDYLPFYG